MIKVTASLSDSKGMLCGQRGGNFLWLSLVFVTGLTFRFFGSNTHTHMQTHSYARKRSRATRSSVCWCRPQRGGFSAPLSPLSPDCYSEHVWPTSTLHSLQSWGYTLCVISIHAGTRVFSHTHEAGLNIQNQTHISHRYSAQNVQKAKKHSHKII